MTRLVVGLAILGVAATANADPYFTYTVEHLGGGVFGSTVWVHGGDGLYGHFFVDVTFVAALSGPDAYNTLYQLAKPYVGGPIDTEQLADDWDGIVDYLKAHDTWIGDPFSKTGANIKDITPVPDPEAHPIVNLSYHFAAGTPGGEGYEQAKLAYVVSDGPVWYEGVLTRQQVTFGEISGIIPAEPGAMMLLAAGAVAVLRRRRR